MLYPIGIQDFEKIRRDGFVYVDKTALIYKLTHGSGRYCFLSRPRRFGKSLLVSTMEAYFRGRKDLFEGLAVASLEKEWKEYPVLRIDLSGKSYTSPTDLQQHLDLQLTGMETTYGIDKQYDSADLRFQRIIEAAYAKTGLRVVILIDEYDKPIIDNLGNEALADVFRSQLQGFYSVMKSKDGFIRFGFLTGVSKIGKLSVFSGLNNLVDISLDTPYADICGISEAELKAYFGDSVKALAEANRLSEEACYQKLALWYDGYHFSEESEGVYNPFSLLNTFSSLRFREYWFFTGTPTFLIRYLSDGEYDLNDVSGIKASSFDLSGVNPVRPNIISLLYQTGYLTIKDYDSRTDRYSLVYPNKEVEDGFLDALSEYFTPVIKSKSSLSVDKFIEDIQNGAVEMLMRRFSAFFADMDYQIMGDDELYFQNTMYVMLKLMGQQVEVERHTSNGRIDALIQTDKYVYILA
ncbi:MAG: AAA family ATPase [Prevotella sp.]|nr:AAA family ATPase [Prevotella sp.]